MLCIQSWWMPEDHDSKQGKTTFKGQNTRCYPIPLQSQLGFQMAWEAINWLQHKFQWLRVCPQQPLWHFKIYFNNVGAFHDGCNELHFSRIPPFVFFGINLAKNASNFQCCGNFYSKKLIINIGHKFLFINIRVENQIIYSLNDKGFSKNLLWTIKWFGVKVTYILPISNLGSSRQCMWCRIISYDNDVILKPKMSCWQGVNP